jgi:hypothetical protein
MSKSSDFENILDECLERLFSGEALEQCLQRYPEQAAQLEPLLRMAQSVREASAIQPRSEFKAKARYEFRSALQAAASKKKLPLFGWRPRLVTALMVTSICLLAGGGTAVAATRSMPDSPFYPVKLATEQIQVRLATSDEDKARLYVTLADKRVAEIIYLADKGDAQRIDSTTQRLDDHLVMLTDLVSVQEEAPMLMAPPAPEAAAPAEEAPRAQEAAPAEEAPGEADVYGEEGAQTELEKTVAYHAAKNQDALRTELEEAPEPAKPALLQAIAVSEAGYGKALAALE